MEKDKSKLLAVVLAILTIVVVTISFVFSKNKDNSGELKIVTNPSAFFTVNSCLYRVTNYVSKKDADSLVKVLSKDYKKKNKININNVLNSFPNLSSEVTFSSKKMYYQEVNDSIKKYYVKGVIKSNILHDYNQIEKEEENNTYFIVYLDSKSQLFSVEPYNGEIFQDGDANE